MTEEVKGAEPLIPQKVVGMIWCDILILETGRRTSQR